MSRRWNLGLIVFAGLLLVLTAFAIRQGAQLPDPDSCVGRHLKEWRDGRPGEKPPVCRRRP